MKDTKKKWKQWLRAEYEGLKTIFNIIVYVGSIFLVLFGSAILFGILMGPIMGPIMKALMP